MRTSSRNKMVPRSRFGLLGLFGLLLLAVVGGASTVSVQAAEDATPSEASPRPAPPAAEAGSSPVEPSATDNGSEAAKAAELSKTSTLAQWKAATAAERSHLAVELAREQLPPGAGKLDLATAAMEITGCLTATARDPKFERWEIAATALTCLTAPERQAQ